MYVSISIFFSRNRKKKLQWILSQITQENLGIYLARPDELSAPMVIHNSQEKNSNGVLETDIWCSDQKKRICCPVISWIMKPLDAFIKNTEKLKHHEVKPYCLEWRFDGYGNPQRRFHVSGIGQGLPTAIDIATEL